MRQALERADKESKRDFVIKSCASMFAKLPQGADGDASMSDVQKMLPKIQHLFESIGVHMDSSEIESCVQIMDTDFSGAVSQEEFTHFLLQVSEPVSPMLILEIRRSVNEFVLQQGDKNKDDIMEKIGVRLNRMEQEQSSLKSQLSAGIAELKTCMSSTTTTWPGSH